jgi:hypothetical protein
MRFLRGDFEFRLIFYFQLKQTNRKDVGEGETVLEKEIS